MKYFNSRLNALINRLPKPTPNKEPIILVYGEDDSHISADRKGLIIWVTTDQYRNDLFQLLASGK